MDFEVIALCALVVFLVWCSRQDNSTPHARTPSQEGLVNLSRWRHDGSQPKKWSAYD